MKEHGYNQTRDLKENQKQVLEEYRDNQTRDLKETNLICYN